MFARGEEALHAVVARLAVYVLAVVGGAEGPERFAVPIGTHAEEAIEQRRPRPPVHRSRLRDHPVEVEDHGIDLGLSDHSVAHSTSPPVRSRVFGFSDPTDTLDTWAAGPPRSGVDEAPFPARHPRTNA